MSQSRFVRPDTAKLDLSNGDWILVKRRLTAGEERAIYARTYINGVMTPTELRISTVMGYLLDWSFMNEQGPVPIRGLSNDDLKSVLDNLDVDDFRELSDAIEKHEAAMTKERADSKNALAGETKSSPTSPSPDGATGPTNTFETSIQT